MFQDKYVGTDRFCCEIGCLIYSIINKHLRKYITLLYEDTYYKCNYHGVLSQKGYTYCVFFNEHGPKPKDIKEYLLIQRVKEENAEKEISK